jgi:hypothetical protein
MLHIPTDKQPEAVTGHKTQLKVVKVFSLIGPDALPEAERGRQCYCGADTVPPLCRQAAEPAREEQPIAALMNSETISVTGRGGL